jgi:hypothetical protein
LNVGAGEDSWMEQGEVGVREKGREEIEQG